jgi:hypothetical protein
MARKGNSGQALVLVLLSLSVVLTIILYILSRSVTDVAVSSKQEEAVRAFSAAEAGIERSLVTGASYGTAVNRGDATYTTAVTGFASGGTDLPFPYAVSYGDTVTVWFVSHDANGNLSCNAPLPCFSGLNPSINICWGNPGTLANSATTPAVELSVYYETPAGSAANIRIGRTAIDPNAGRRVSNSFTTDDGGTCTIGSQTYAFHKTVFFSSIVPAAALSYQNANGLQLAQIRMLYNDVPHTVGVSVTGGFLPSQGQRIDSSGVAGDSNRRIVVYQGWPEFPFASNAVISPVGITK